MGQYWKPVNLDREESVSMSGVKLMEHSWILNAGMNYVMDLLSNRWKGNRIKWIGDYSDQDPDYNLYEDAHCIKDMDWNESFPFDSHLGFLVNHTKKEYVSMEHYIKNLIQTTKSDEWFVHPLSLLCAAHSNGDGGGDYRAEAGADDIGRWCGDALSYETEFDATGFTMITPVFTEGTFLDTPLTEAQVNEIFDREFNHKESDVAVVVTEEVPEEKSQEEIDKEYEDDLAEISDDIAGGSTRGVTGNGTPWELKLRP